MKIYEDIHNFVFITDVNDTCNKLFTVVNGTAIHLPGLLTPVITPCYLIFIDSMTLAIVLLLVLLLLVTNNTGGNLSPITPVRHRPEQNRVTWETPSSEAIPLLPEQIGVLASYATRTQMQV
jgi:hypothetical protein